MDTEIKREDIYYNKHIVSSKADINVDCDIIVPDTLPDAEDILSVNSIPKITGRELQNDRILIYGSVDYRIIYNSEEKHPESISFTTSFTDVIDLPKALPGMDVSLDYDNKTSECKILNGRKLSVKTVVGVNIDVYNKTQLSPVYDIVSVDTEKKFAEFSFMTPNTDFEKIFEVNDRVEIPVDKISASQILDTISYLSEKDVRVINNKVIVKGEIITDIIYRESESEEIKSISQATPFTEILDVDGITEDCFSYTNISLCGISCQSDEYAIRDFEISAELRARVYCYKNDTVKLVDDCYSISSDCVVTREDILMPVSIKSFSGQLSMKENLSAGVSISGVLNVNVNAETEKTEIENGKITVKGKLNAKVLCNTSDEGKTVMLLKKSIPFSYSAEYISQVDQCICDTYCEATGPSYSLNPDGSIDLRCNVAVCGIVHNKVSFAPVTDISFEERKNPAKTASVTVYFVQEKDDLWSIAKKYLTSTDKIRELNKLETDILKKGMKLFIPKYKQIS